MTPLPFPSPFNTPSHIPTPATNPLSVPLFLGLVGVRVVERPPFPFPSPFNTPSHIPTPATNLPVPLLSELLGFVGVRVVERPPSSSLRPSTLLLTYLSLPLTLCRFLFSQGLLEYESLSGGEIVDIISGTKPNIKGTTVLHLNNIIYPLAPSHASR